MNELHALNARIYEWIVHYGPRILIAIGLLTGGQWLIRIVRGWLSRVLQKRRFDASLKPFLLSLIVTVMQVLLILTVMQVIGVQMTVFAALIGGIGVAFGLALSGTLQNFTSGILILLLKPYRVGDTILAQGQEGTVSAIQVFYTFVTTFDNKTVIIPNSKLSNELIVNLSREGIRRMDIEFKFNYGVAFEQVKAVIEHSASESPEVLNIPAPRIGILFLDPDGYRMAINVWTNAHGFVDAKMKFQQKIINDLKAAGIKLAGM